MGRQPIKKLRGWGLGKENLDPGIRSLVEDLNIHGYRTWASCEGGTGHGYSKAWISFGDIGSITSDEIGELKSIVRKHTSVPFKVTTYRGTLSIVFSKPLSKDRWTRAEEEGEGEDDPSSWSGEEV